MYVMIWKQCRSDWRSLLRIIYFMITGSLISFSVVANIISFGDLAVIYGESIFLETMLPVLATVGKICAVCMLIGLFLWVDTSCRGALDEEGNTSWFDVELTYWRFFHLVARSIRGGIVFASFAANFILFGSVMNLIDSEQLFIGFRYLLNAYLWGFFVSIALELIGSLDGISEWVRRTISRVRVFRSTGGDG